MNSLRFPRRRPRVASVHFGSLHWVVLREAVYRLGASGADRELDARFRSTLCASSSYVVRRLGESLLARWPSRRWRP